jgi:hypothetical protein
VREIRLWEISEVVMKFTQIYDIYIYNLIAARKEKQLESRTSGTWKLTSRLNMFAT